MAEFEETNPLLIGVQGDEDQAIKNPDPDDVDGDGIPDAIDPVIEVLGETVEDEQTQISDAEAEELIKLHAQQEEDRLEQELEQRRIDEEKAHRERTMNTNLSYGVELEQRNENQIFLDDLEERNYNMNRALSKAERDGLNVEDVASEMRRRNGVSRERYNYQFEENLADLKATKQRVINERERMKRKTEDEYDIDYDLIEGSDTEFIDSYGRLEFLKDQLAKFEAGKLSDGDIINFYQQLDEVYGLELGTEAEINAATKSFIEKSGLQYLPDSPLTGAAGGATMAAVIGQLGPQVGLPEEVVTVPAGATLGYILGSLRSGGEFLGDKMGRAFMQMGLNPDINPLAGESREDYLTYTGELMNWLIEEETGTLGEFVNDQNDINGKVKFRTDFTIDDADYIYSEIVDRDEDLKYFNDTHRHFSEEGLNIGESALYIVKPFTDIIEAGVVGAGQFLEHETGIDFVNEQRKQNREAYMSALELAGTQVGFGLEEENIQRTWFGTTGAMFNGDVSVGEWAQKSGKFLHSLSGDMITAYLAYGRSAKSSSKFVRQAVPNIYTGTMFFRGYKHFQDSLDKREDLAEDEKHLLSSIAGASEAFLAHTLRYAERGLAGNWKKPTKNMQDTIKRRAGETKKQARARSLEEAKKLGKAAWRKAMWTEAFEEGAQSLIEQNLANVYDMALGKTPQREFNVWEFMDSAFGGLIFGTAGGRGAYRQQIAHHTILQKTESVKKALEILQGKLDRTPPGELRDEYEREYLDFQDQLFELNSIGRGFYSRLDSEQTGKVRQINNRLIELQYLIGDKETSKEEREDLLKEFESLYKQKSEIESSVLTEADLAEINKERPNSENIIDKLISRLTESQDVSDETSTDHEGKTSRPAAEVQEEAETISQINKLLEQYKSSREKALQEKDPRKKRALQAAASRARTRARKLANQIGITGSDFVQVLDNAEQGEFITQPEVAPETTEAVNRIKEIDAELAELEGDPTGVKTQAQLDRISELKAERKNLVEQSMVAPDAAPEAEGATEDDVDFTEDKTVYDLGGEGNTIEDADPRISRMIVNAVNRLNKAFKKVLKALNATIHIHNTENSFYGVTESLKKKGRVDLLTRTQANQSITWGVMLTKPDGSIEIHLNPEARVEDVSEEFAHAVLLPILRRDSKARRALYNELLKMAGLREVTTKDETGKDVTMLQVIPGAEFNEAARSLLMNRGAAYEGESQAMFEEEAIVGFLKEYAKPDGASKFETPDTRSKLRKFWDGVKGMFRRFTKRNKSEANIINYNDSLLDFARKFSKATKGVETDVQARPGAEQQAAPAAEEAAESRGQRFILNPQTNKPIVFYHGTNRQSADRIRKEGFQGEQISLTNSKRQAQNYATSGPRTSGDKAGGLIESHVTLNNPMDFQQNFALRKKIIGEMVGKSPEELTKQGFGMTSTDWTLYGGKINKEFIRRAKEMGHDGVYSPNQSEVIVFDSNNIKVIAPAAEEAAESRGQRFSSTQQKIFNEMGEGVELFFNKVFEREGTDGITRVTGVQKQSIKVNDYYHFKNAYAKFTGNGQNPSLMKDMYYIDSNGDKQQVNPPRPKLDKEGNVIQMAAPQSLSYGQRLIQQRLKERDTLDEVRSQVVELQNSLYDLLRSSDKNLNRYTQVGDFSPVKRDEFAVGPGRQSLEDHMEELENLIITKANIQALIDSEITEEDLKALKGRGDIVSPSKHASIYNMSGMLKESQKQEALDLQDPDSSVITLSEGTDPDSMIEGEEEAFSQGYRTIPEIQNDSELGDAIFQNLKIFGVDLEDISIVDLLAEGSAGLGVVSYDQLSKIENFELKFVDGGFNINSGVGQLKESLDAGENLSLSHASATERQKTINRLRESWNRGDRLFHVFINNNSHKEAYKNPSLFGPLVQNVIGAAKSNETSLTEKEVLKLFKDGLSVEAFNQGAQQKGNKTGYQFVEFSPQFRAMTDAQKAELGWNGSEFDVQTIEQLEKLMDLYTLTSSFASRKAFEKKTKFLGEKFANKHGLPALSDISNNLIEHNYVGEKGANKAGVVSTVLTIDLNQIFDESGNIKEGALAHKEGLPFGYQILGAQNLRKLSKKRSTRALFDVSPQAAANDLITDTVGGTKSIDMARTEEQLKERDDREQAIQDVDADSSKRDTASRRSEFRLEDRTYDKAKQNNFKRQDALDKLQEIKDRHQRGEVSASYLEGFEQKTQAQVKGYEKIIKDQGGQVAETQAVKPADIKLTLNNTNQVETPTAEQLSLFDEIVQANSQGYRQINVPGDPATWNLKEQSTMERAMENFQKKFVDKYQAILNLQQQVEESKGGRIPEGQDFKMMETLLYGKAATDIEKLDNKTKALVDSMKENGVTEPELSEYLYALHAKERNAVILERTGEQNGSGMSDADADAILNKLSPEKKAQLEKSAAIVRDILKNTRDTYIALGLHTKEDIDAWEDMFEHYIPLQGWAVDEDNDITSAYPTGGKSLSVTDSMVKRATGRKTAAANVVAQVIAQNAAAHIKGRTNEAVRALYNLIESNPNDKVWKILDWADRSDPHVVGVRVDGQQKWIYFNDVSHAETLRGMNMPSTSFLPKILKSATGWLRASFTTLNPEFVISNFSRDIQSAIFNAAAEAEIEGGQLNGEGVIQQMIKDVPRNLKALLRGAVGLEMSAEEAAWFQDFIEDGGRTGWAYAKDLNEIAQELSEAASDKSRMQEILGKAKNFKKAVEGVNDAFENAIRLSAYMAARKAGISRSKAAEFAKNITVNFNKHGEYGQALNAIYLFFNASIQGTARLGRSLLGSKPASPDGVKRNWFQRRTNAQKMAFGLGIFNAMLTMLNYALSDDDEDGVPYYDKIPDYVKERNLIIMNPAGGGVGKDYIKIPMPYGFNVFANFGSAAVEYANGGRELDSAGMFLFNSTVSSFSPISFGQSEDLFKYGAKALSPTVIKPWVEAAVNETYFGTPVTAEQNPFATPKPNSSMSFRSPDAVKQFFSWMNEATGGTVHRGGIVDINPDKFWYIFQYYTGGVGQFVTRTGETTLKIGQRLLSEGGEDIKINYNDIPMLRKMYGETSKYYDFNKYYENKETIKQLRREIQDPDIKFDSKRHNNVNTLNNKLNSIEKQLKQLRKKLREAKDMDNYVDRTVRVQELQDKQRKLVMQFNEMYDKLRNNE